MPNFKATVRLTALAFALAKPGTTERESVNKGLRTRLRVGLGRALPVLLVGVLLAVPALLHTPGAEAIPNTWSPAGSMATARVRHTATLLLNGKVLVTGGTRWDEANVAWPRLTSAELYDPDLNSWSPAGSMTTGRVGHTATLLPNGKVLVTGGENDYWAWASAEIYDPDTNSWSPAGGMGTSRFDHTATLLSSGKVLVVGGTWGPWTFNSSAELYDPDDDSWFPAASLVTPRSGHTATLLPSGKVLAAAGTAGIWGGGAWASAEFYDPDTNSWSSAGSMATARLHHSATLLPNGRVLVTGGDDNSGVPAVTASAELYDSNTNSWAAAASMATARAAHTATTLLNGTVLTTGGPDGASLLASAELYDQDTTTWSLAASMATARTQHTATLLPSGKVVVVGGQGVGGATLTSAELYEPGQPWKLPYAPDARVRWTGGPHALNLGSQFTVPFPAGQGSGLDFAGGAFEVRAIAGGTVVKVNNTCSSTALGCFVAIKHDGSGSVAVYAHLAPGSPQVSEAAEGQPPNRVVQSQPIATAGSSGAGANGKVHLHLELRNGDTTDSACTGQSDCFGAPLDWDGTTIDGWMIHEYFTDASRTAAYNYDGSATKGAVADALNFPYLDEGATNVWRVWPAAAVAKVGSTFHCDYPTATPAPHDSCEKNAQSQLCYSTPTPTPSATGTDCTTLTQFATLDGGDLRVGGASGGRAMAPPLGVADQSAQLLSSNGPATLAVGGIGDAPDPAALPAQTSTASAGNRAAYALAGGAAAALAIVAAGGWAMRRRRNE